MKERCLSFFFFFCRYICLFYLKGRQDCSICHDVGWELLQRVPQHAEDAGPIPSCPVLVSGRAAQAADVEECRQAHHQPAWAKGAVWCRASTQDLRHWRLHWGNKPADTQQDVTWLHQTPFLCCPCSSILLQRAKLFQQLSGRCDGRVCQRRWFFCALGPYYSWSLCPNSETHLQISWPGEALPEALITHQTYLTGGHEHHRCCCKAAPAGPVSGLCARRNRPTTCLDY